LIVAVDVAAPGTLADAVSVPAGPWARVTVSVWGAPTNRPPTRVSSTTVSPGPAVTDGA